jgi:hypothetical protein
VSCYEEVSRSAPKARKTHKCIWCGQPIEAGKQYVYVAYRFLGDFQTNKFHPECVKPCEEECSDGDGEFMPYENARGLKETNP